MLKQIAFTKPYTAELIDYELSELKGNQVKVQTYFSTISCGTEKANLIGDPNVGTDIKEGTPAVFPRVLGYSSSGIVIDKGEDVKSVNIGDRVVMSWSKHQSVNILLEKNVVKIENDNMSLEEAAMCQITTFPMAAIRKTRLEIGESMLVMGLGILGIMAVQFSRAAGAVPVIAVDPNPERRALAMKFGADYALDPFEKDFAEKVINLTGGGVNCAIEVTGLGAGLNQCLDVMAKFGRVALLGCTRDKNFTVDYYRKVHGPGIELIGAHTNARPYSDSSPHYFTQRDDIKAMLKLLSLGRINLKDMIMETYSPVQCGEVYTRLANDSNFPIVVQFDWHEFIK